MKSLFLLISFFTRLPVPRVAWSDAAYRRALPLIPLVGLLIGILLFCASLMLHLVLGSFVTAVGLFAAYVFVTGGLHLDGLADTCDGMFSGRSRERALEIMKDSRVGAFGVLALVLAALAYVALFTETPPLALLVFPVVGRSAVLLAALRAPYARAEGMGKPTAEGNSKASAISALVSVIAASLLLLPLGWLFVFLATGISATLPFLLLPVAASLIAVAVVAVLTLGITRSCKRRLGGVTGDTFGAIIEVSSIAYLASFSSALALLERLG